MTSFADVRTCNVCGCSEYDACLVEGVPCMWVAPELCSNCADLSDILSAPGGIDWVLAVACHCEAHGPQGVELCAAELEELAEYRRRRETEDYDD